MPDNRAIDVEPRRTRCLTLDFPESTSISKHLTQSVSSPSYTAWWEELLTRQSK